jgi:hypothetical protein
MKSELMTLVVQDVSGQKRALARDVGERFETHYMQGVAKITHDLDRYTDLYHFEPAVNEWLVEEACGERYRVRPDTVDTLDRELRRQAQAFLLGASGDAHEKPQDSGHGTEGVHVVVVEAEAHVSIGEAGIQSFGAEKMIAGADSGAGSVAIFAAKCIKTRRCCVGHSRIELHFGGFVLLTLRFGQRRGLGGQLKIMPIIAGFGAAPRVGHSIFEFRRGTPNSPPYRFGLEKIAQRMIGVFLFHALRCFDGSRKVKGINLVENGGRFGGQSEFG